MRVELYPRSQIDIYVEVLQADGGEYRWVPVRFLGINTFTQMMATGN